MDNPYSKRARYRHEELEGIPRGAVVRTVMSGGHPVRIAFWGKNTGGRHAHSRVISVLHPKSERNPRTAEIEGLARAIRQHYPSARATHSPSGRFGVEFYAPPVGWVTVYSHGDYWQFLRDARR